MGFLDDLILGSSPSLETRSLSTISPEQREELNRLLASLNRTPTAFGGDRSAGLSSLENASLAALEERSRALALPDQNLEAAGASVRDQLDFQRNTGDANEFFTSAIQNPALDAFQREVLPSISRDFGGGSFFSTERQATEGLARRDLLSSLTAERARVNLDQFNQARNRALQAAGLTPALSGAENERTRTQLDILNAAGIEREVEQDALDRTYLEFVRQQEEVARLEDLRSRSSLTPTIENIGMTDPGNAGLIATLLGGLAQGAGGALGQAAGGGLTSLLERLFGSNAPDGTPNGGTPADGETGTTVTDTSGGGGLGDVAGAVGGAGAVGAGAAAAGAGTPGGTVTITDAAGNIIPSVASGGGAAVGGAGLAGLVNSIQPGIQAGIAGTEAANAAALGNLPMPTLGVADAAGNAAGAPAGSGGSIASGVGTALAIAGALYGGYNTVQAARAGDTQSAALSGAATGAAVGSIVPVIGTAVGAVIGGLAGAIGAAFGDSERPSERAYGAYKKVPGEVTVRNWTQQQVDGAMFEAIKSHTRSGNAERFADVREMLAAFGKGPGDVSGIQTDMKNFIKGVISTSQASGGLPTDAKELAKLDGQQIYYKLIAPAMAAKIQEATGASAQSNTWSGDLQTKYGDSVLHNIFADVADYMVANWATGGINHGTNPVNSPLQQRNRPGARDTR